MILQLCFCSAFFIFPHITNTINSHIIDMVALAINQIFAGLTELEAIKILVIDDDKVIRLYLKRILQVIDPSISQVSDGEEVFDLIKDKGFDVIFVDINLPSQPGIKVIEKLRQQPRFLDTTIIVMTGLEQPDLIKIAFDVGANDYIAKP